MNHDTDQITDTFAAHEHLAPDAEIVLARAKEIARTYQRRRWAVRATGGAVLGAGLVAGGIAIPSRAGGHGATETVSPASSGGDASPTPSATPSKYTQEQDWAAYFAAGYDYNDAVKLQNMWNDSANIGTVKAEAGEKLLEGQKLPVDPSGTPETPAQKAQDAFFAAGYDYQDAVTLGNKWNESDVTQVKTEAGQMLLDGKPLPIQPSGEGLADPSATPTSASGAGESSASSAENNDLYAFFAAGYTYDDAVAIAKAWNESDPYQVKAEAGKKLLAGGKLPVDPSGTPASKQDNEFHAFFAAGYTYDDAVRLGKTWHESNIDQVKADAGQKLIDGEKLPIAP